MKAGRFVVDFNFHDEKSRMEAALRHGILLAPSSDKRAKRVQYMLNVVHELHPSVTDKNGNPVNFPTMDKDDLARLLLVDFDTHAGHLIWSHGANDKISGSPSSTGSAARQQQGIEWNYLDKSPAGTLQHNK
jgi:hypothetical protein